MRGIDDDDLSYRSGSVSRSSSCKSFPGNFGIDWDEIDSIAEESLSVASSASSSHRKRTRRRTNTSINANQQLAQSTLTLSQMDDLENGVGFVSSSRFSGHAQSTSASKSSPHGCRSSASVGNRSKTPPQPSQSRPHIAMVHHQRKQRRRMLHDLKRLVIIGVLIVMAIISIDYFGDNLNSNNKHISALRYSANSITSITNKFGADRSARRALSRSATIYAGRQWPLSVRDEQPDFEFLPHPTPQQHDKVMLSLPRFFLTRAGRGGDNDDTNPGGAGVTLETLGRVRPLTHQRAVANLVGRTTVEGSRDFSVRTIFVGIPSYRDWHCRYTVESIFGRAKYPERIRVGVVDQLEGPDQSCDLPIEPCSEKPFQALCQYRDQIDVYEMDHKLAVGPTFARHIVNRLYRGEYYALQISSHTTFTKNWDADLIDQWEETGNEMGVITTYLGDASGSIDDRTGVALKKSRMVLCSATFEGTGHDRRLRHAYGDQPDLLPAIERVPQLQPFWSSSFSFSRGHFILTVPYDPYLPMVSKSDEEISMAFRAFTHGYDFYTPVSNVCFDSARKDDLTSFEENKSIYNGVEKVSLRRLDNLLRMEAEKNVRDANELFGLGQARPLSKFFTAFGVHPAEHITEHKLCNFVTNGRMHELFQKHLRDDGMGLNYDLIHFRFHELQDNHDA
ncbi:glycosyltransferase [Fragilaria crotonensis]|nr:glycosyltransferase [Fragilaria crotonensis]